MSPVIAIFRREFGAWFDSFGALATTALFVLVLHALFFFAGYEVGDVRLPSFFEGRTATLRTLFVWLPLLFVVLVPAITMGAWAEERRAGTEELLLTQPLRGRHAVLGKFLACWSLVALVVLVAIAPAAVVVSRLGPLDWGTVLAGSLGAVALAGAFAAIGLWISALSGDQLIAFLLSAVALGALFGLGLAADLLPAWAARPLHWANPATHYTDSAALGLLDARDLVYYALLVVLALWLNTSAVDARRFGGRR